MSAAAGPPPRLSRPKRALAIVSLTPLVDVLLILVVFFLVTSTYLDLDMIPMVETEADAPHGASPAPGDAAAMSGPSALLIRIAADGRTFLGGDALAPEALAEAIGARLADRPGTRVLILPSPLAPTQALVDALGAAAEGGAPGARVVRIAPAGADE